MKTKPANDFTRQKRPSLRVNVAVAAVLAVVSAQPVIVNAAETIKLGLITDLSSFLRINGKAVREASIMALEEVDYRVAGKTLELIVEDSGSKPAIALDKARKMVQSDNVAIVLGPFNGSAAAAVGNYVGRIGKPNIVSWYSMSAKDVVASKWSWAPFGTLEQLSTPSGIYAYDVLGYRTMSAFGTDYVAGRRFVGGATEAFKSRGGKVVQEQWFPLGTKDIAPYINALKPADFVAPWLAGITATVGLQQLREFKVDKPIVMPQTGFMAHPGQIKQIGENGVGVISTDAYVWTIDTAENKDFVARYKKRWGEVPAGAAYGGYFTTQMAIAALRKTGGNTDESAIANALDATKMTGLLGDFQFGEGRVGIANYIVHQVVKSSDKDYPYQTKILAKYRVHPTLNGKTLSFRAERITSKN